MGIKSPTTNHELIKPNHDPAIADAMIRGATINEAAYDTSQFTQRETESPR